MGYSIICDARKGAGLGVNTLALVDRALSKKLWWTSDNPSIILNYSSLDSAKFALKRLRLNNPRIVDHKKAVQIVFNQCSSISDTESERDLEIAMGCVEDGWDGHKNAM